MMNILSGQGPKLLSAAERGDLEVVQSLIKSNPKLITHKSLYGNNSLHNAAANGRLDVVVWLVEEGKADPSVPDGNGKTALWRARNNQHNLVVIFLQTKEIPVSERVAGGDGTACASARLVPIPPPPPQEAPLQEEKFAKDDGQKVADSKIIAAGDTVVPVPPPPPPPPPPPLPKVKSNHEWDDLARKLQTASMEELVMMADRLGLSNPTTTALSPESTNGNTNSTYYYYQGELADFFEEYDNLRHKAQTLRVDRSAHQTASAQHQLTKDKFEKATSSVQWNLGFIKEQKDRIDCVSHHWFYGTTALQPQLWFRGGCEGKIERATEKLHQSQQDHPKLIQIVEQYREKELVAQEILRRKEVALKISSDADQQMKQRKEELVVNHYPSTQLKQLQEDEFQTTREIDIEKKHQTKLHQISTQLKNAKSCAQRVESNVRFANRNYDEAERLLAEKEENYFRKPGENETDGIERGDSTYAMDLHQKQQQRQQHKKKMIESKRQQAYNNLQKAAKDLQTGYEQLRNAVSSSLASSSAAGGSSSSSSVLLIMPSPIVVMAGGCCSRGTCSGCGNNGRMLLVQAQQLESAIQEQESVLSNKLQCVNRECSRLQQQLAILQSEIVKEKDTIFDSLRRRSCYATQKQQQQQQQQQQNEASGTSSLKASFMAAAPAAAAQADAAVASTVGTASRDRCTPPSTSPTASTDTILAATRPYYERDPPTNPNIISATASRSDPEHRDIPVATAILVPPDLQ